MPKTFTIDMPEDAAPAPRTFTVDMPEDTARTGPAETPGPLAETALHLGSSILSFPVGLGAGIAGMLLPGERGQGADYMGRVQNAMTYQPKSEGGMMLSDIVTAPFRWLGQGSQWAGEKVTDITGSPVAGAVTQETLRMAPAIIAGAVGAKLKDMKASKIAELARKQSQNAQLDATLQRAREAGYVVPSPDVAGRTLSSIGGKSVLRQEMGWKNQQVTNEIARREAGLGNAEPITIETLKDARYGMEAPYRQAANLSPTARGALEEMKAARADATAWFKAYNRSLHPEDLAKARKFQAEEQIWYNELEQEAAARGAPGLVDRLKEARVKLAKNHDVERALIPGSGDVDAGVIGRMYAKSPQRFSGGLETIGRFANGPGREVTRSTAAIGQPGGQHGQIVESALGAAAGGLQGGVKGAVLGAGLPLARIPARWAAMRMFPSADYVPGVSLRALSPGVAGTLAVAPALSRPPYQPQPEQPPPWWAYGTPTE